ncbi:MAG: HAMP domain-containing sensor histidine kinase, partial [Planctomycetota bacterium]
RPIYQWGNSSKTGHVTLLNRSVVSPLASWRLILDVDPNLVPQVTVLPIFASLAGVAVVVLTLGGYALSSVRRQIADAKRRVGFAGQVSHELRTPLTNLRLYTELAEQDVDRLDDVAATASLKKRLSVIDHESRRLQRLVSGVLEMIRPSGKTIEPRRQSVDVCELLGGIAEQFEPSFQTAGIQTHLDCSIESAVHVDPDIVEQVVVNLMGNVEKYVPVKQGSNGACTVSANLLSKDSQDWLQIIVDDNGPGIDRNDRRRIFRPFERLDDSIHAPSGTGIGLTIARLAARRHGGDLVLLSRSNLGGAAFELSLPLPETS